MIKSGTPIGPKLARRIESACGQPAEGWLDQPQEGQTEPGSAAALPRPRRAASPQAPADALGLAWTISRMVSDWLNRRPAGFPSPVADHRVQRIDLNAELVQHEEATMLVRVRHPIKDKAGILDGTKLVVDKPLSARMVTSWSRCSRRRLHRKQLHWDRSEWTD